MDDDKTQRDQIEKEHDVLVAENAIRMYEKKVKGLYREGEKIFSDAEHEALEQRYLQELSGAVNAQIGVAEKRQASAEEELRALSYYDPVASLSAGERDRLSTSAQFIKEDARPSPYQISKRGSPQSLALLTTTRRANYYMLATLSAAYKSTKTRPRRGGWGKTTRPP